MFNSIINSPKKRLILAGVFAVIGILLIFTTSKIINNNSDHVPESSFIPSDAPATLLNSEELFAELKPFQFDQLRNDLTNYSRNYKKTESESITYKFKGFKSKNDQELVFALESGNTPEHALEVKLTKLPVQRIKLSFIDKDSRTSDFDSNLKSNSKRNDFISTLPVNDRLYTVEYNLETNKFILVLYEHSDNVRLQARKAVETGVSPETVSDSDFEILAPGRFEDPPLEKQTIEGD